MSSEYINVYCEFNESNVHSTPSWAARKRLPRPRRGWVQVELCEFLWSYRSETDLADPVDNSDVVESFLMQRLDECISRAENAVGTFLVDEEVTAELEAPFVVVRRSSVFACTLHSIKYKLKARSANTRAAWLHVLEQLARDRVERARTKLEQVQQRLAIFRASSADREEASAAAPPSKRPRE